MAGCSNDTRPLQKLRIRCANLPTNLKHISSLGLEYSLPLSLLLLCYQYYYCYCSCLTGLLFQSFSRLKALPRLTTSLGSELIPVQEYLTPWPVSRQSAHTWLSTDPVVRSARPTTTFHSYDHSPRASAKWYCTVTEAHGVNNLPTAITQKS